MKVHTSHTLILGLVVTIAAVNAANNRGDYNGDTHGIVTSITSRVGVVPIVGEYLAILINLIIELIVTMQRITHGAVSRFFDGILPCEISTENGLVCTGLEQSGGIQTLLNSILDSIPSLPTFVKKLIMSRVNDVDNEVVSSILKSIFGRVKAT
ncbi:uncharacterized protein LOC105704386 isoform X2 [Orussus abietinus]|uniref:uncharacterized protein LOC105704386 isoform X2 n=1 Tax=Orussus abietinus TaxID=222816 RepID=UPI000625491E|nr:uncharacterized protein LOC105704386 isoform X2 [Orussus abietinus]